MGDSGGSESLNDVAGSPSELHHYDHAICDVLMCIVDGGGNRSDDMCVKDGVRVLDDL